MVLRLVPATETDRHPAAAASRYLVHQASNELLASLLIHDDRSYSGRRL